MSFLLHNRRFLRALLWHIHFVVRHWIGLLWLELRICAERWLFVFRRLHVRFLLLHLGDLRFWQVPNVKLCSEFGLHRKQLWDSVERGVRHVRCLFVHLWNVQLGDLHHLLPRFSLYRQ